MASVAKYLKLLVDDSSSRFYSTRSLNKLGLPQALLVSGEIERNSKRRNVEWLREN